MVKYREREGEGSRSHTLSLSLGRTKEKSVFWCRSLVDPASSHMLVSKIKPCMSKYKLCLHGETADGSLNQSLSKWASYAYLDNCGNSRANTCNLYPDGRPSCACRLECSFFLTGAFIRPNCWGPLSLSLYLGGDLGLGSHYGDSG